MKEDNEQQFSFQSTYKYVKLTIFQITKNYLDCTQNLNPIFIYSLVLVQFLQILSFSMHSLLKFNNQSQVMNYIQLTLSYLNFQQIILQNNHLLYHFVIANTIITILHIITHVILLRIMNDKSQRKSKFFNSINTLSVIQLILFNTVFTIPIFNISVITLYCDKDNPYHQGSHCYDQVYIIMCILSVINLLVLFTQNFAYWFIFYIRDPFQKTYYALPTNLNKLGKLLIKIAPPLYFIIDVHFLYQNVYIFMFLFMTIAYIGFFRILSCHNFSQKYFYLQLYLQSIVTWFAFNSVICFEFDSSGINFIESMICSLLFAYTLCLAESTLTKKFILDNIAGPIKKQDRQKFIFLLVNILFKNTPTYDIMPLVYIKVLYSNLNVTNQKIQKYIMKNQLKCQQMIELSRELMLALLENFFIDNSTQTLKIIKFRLLYDGGLRILALHEAIELYNDKISLYDQFMIYYFKKNHKIYSTQMIKGPYQNVNQIQTYLHFVQQMNEFENKIQNCALNNEQYWQQLCQDMPSINKVFNLAKKGLQYIKSIEETYKKIEQIYKQNYSSLVLYYHFLNDVCVVHFKQCFKIKQKLQCHFKKHQLSTNTHYNEGNTIQFKSNQKMCVFHVSTWSSSIGIILNCNSEVRKFLGYQKRQLLNQKVTKMMPKIFSQIHDNFIYQYLKKADTIKLPTQKIVFALKKNLQIIQTSLAVKIFAHLQFGFQLVGFFKGRNQQQIISHMILNLKTYQIQGINQAFLQMTGTRLKMAQIQKQPLKLSNLFPQLDSTYKFTKNQQISTLFRFSDCTDKLIDVDETTSSEGKPKFEKIVTIIIEDILHYEGGVELAILTIKQAQNIISLKNIKKPKKDQIKIKIEKIKMKLQQKPSKNSNQIIIQQDMIIQRKIQDFLTEKSYQKQTFILKIIFLFCISAFIISMLTINIDKAINAISQDIQQELVLAMNIGISQGKILILNSQIIQQSINATKWQIYKQTFLAQLINLETSITNLFGKSTQRLPQQLVINQFKQYPFNSINPDGILITTYLYYLNGVIQITASSKSMLNSSITSFTSPVSTNVVMGQFFIQDNMKILLPSLADQTIDAYQQLNELYLENMFVNQLNFMIVKSVLLVFLYIAMFFIMRKIGEFAKSVFTIYQSIMKWDAHQLYRKCYNFRVSILQCNVNLQRQNQHSSNLLNLFPKSLLVMLAKGSNKKNMFKKSKRVSVINDIKQFRRQTNTIQRCSQTQNLLNQHPSQTQINKSDLIQITIKDKFLKKFISILIFLLIICSISGIFLFIQDNFKYSMIYENQIIQNVGNFTQSFLFTCFYGIKSIQNYSLYTNLYQQSLTRFYQNSQAISSYFTLQQSNLKQIYKQIQILNSVINNETSSNDYITIEVILQKIQRDLLKASNQMVNYINFLRSQWTSSMQSQITLLKIIKTIVQILLTCIFCKVVLSYIFNPIQKHIIHSMNMVKMLPTWLINKNSKIKCMLKINYIIVDKQKLQAPDQPIKTSAISQVTQQNLILKQSQPQ